MKTLDEKIEKVLTEYKSFLRSSIRKVVKESLKEIEKWLIEEELPAPDCHESHRELVGGYNQALLKTRRMIIQTIKNI